MRDVSYLFEEFAWRGVASAALLLFAGHYLYLLYSRWASRRWRDGQLASWQSRTIDTLALTIQAKDLTTHSHLRRVQIYAVELGTELQLEPQELAALGAAAALHDIGKLAVPEHIISKPGKLTPEEFEKMMIHPIVGAEILENILLPYPAAEIVRAHHEKWDGTGYPYGLRGGQIPLGARILAAVDALDALSSDRQYRRAMSIHQAMDTVEAQSGKSFDPAVVRLLRARYLVLEEKVLAAEHDKVQLTTGLATKLRSVPGAGYAAPVPRPRSTFNAYPETQVGTNDGERLSRDLNELFERGWPAPKAFDEHMDLFVLRVKKDIPFDSAVLHWLSGTELMPAFAHGEDARSLLIKHFVLGEGICGWVAERRKPLLNGSEYANRCVVAVPLLRDELLLGVLSFYREAHCAFTQIEMDSLEQAVGQLATHITEPDLPTDASKLLNKR